VIVNLFFPVLVILIGAAVVLLAMTFIVLLLLAATLIGVSTFVVEFWEGKKREAIELDEW
jgi:hypothetical protein